MRQEFAYDEFDLPAFIAAIERFTIEQGRGGGLPLNQRKASPDEVHPESLEDLEDLDGLLDPRAVRCYECTSSRGSGECEGCSLLGEADDGCDAPALDPVVEVHPDGTIKEFPLGTPRDLIAELAEAGKTLFFQFTEVNVLEPIPCADGHEYEFDPLPADEDYLGEVVPPEPEHEFGMGESDVVGLMVSVKDNRLQLESAIFSLGSTMPPCPPSVDALPHADVFEAPLAAFVAGFRKLISHPGNPTS